MQKLNAAIVVAFLVMLFACGGGGQDSETNQTVDKSGKSSTGKGGDGTVSRDEWAQPGEAVIQGDIRVSIVSARIGIVDLNDLGRRSQSKNEKLVITLRIENRNDSKKISYTTWAAQGTDILTENKASLSDDLGNTYSSTHFGFATDVIGQVSVKSVYPEKAITDVLVFEKPVSKASLLKLQLPAKAFGGSGQLRLSIALQESKASEPVAKTEIESPTKHNNKAVSAAERKKLNAEIKRKETAVAAQRAKEEREKNERQAGIRLKFAKSFLDKGDKITARKRLKQIVDENPGTPAAVEAAKLLKGINP